MGEALLTATCDADLAQASRPIVSTTFYSRDPKKRVGRTQHIDLPGYARYLGDFVIHDVTITCDGPALNPLRQVQAASTAFTLADLFRTVALK